MAQNSLLPSQKADISQGSVAICVKYDGTINGDFIHRGGHGGRVPRAPYHVSLHQNDNRQFVFGADFWRVTRYITAYN